jgi:hypothetical protein
MTDSLFQFKTNYKNKMEQIVKELSYLLNNKDQKLSIIYRKEEKEKSQLKISLIFQDKF